MANYYLYLDESGQFNDSLKNSATSIIAGFISEKNLTETQARDLLVKIKGSSSYFSNIDIEHFHSMEQISSELCEFIVSLLESMAQKNFRFIVFKSDKNYVGINSDVTYLNIFAEGIVNLLQQLLSKNNDEVFLKVLYASRLNVSEKYKHGIYLSIDEESYLERIEERISWRMLRLKNSERDRIKKKFSSAKATESTPLMLADAVCFALRGGRKNFTISQKERLKNLPVLYFSFPEKISWNEIQNALIENRIGEAIFSWYGRKEKNLSEEHNEFFKESVTTKLKSMDFTSRKLQYDTISKFIGNLVDIGDFDSVKNFVVAMDKNFFPLTEKNNIYTQELFFDLHFYRLTIATHEGKTLDEQHEINICREILPKLPTTCETLDYFLKYKLREVEYLKNIYDFSKAIAELDKLEKILSNMIELLKMIDDLGDFAQNIRSTTLGKVLGSRAMSKIYLLHSCPQNLDLEKSSRKDLNLAIEQFTNPNDKSRQFQNYSTLETIVGNFQEALSRLGEAFDAKNNPTPAEVLTAIKDFSGQKNFGLLHFVNLMAAADINLRQEMLEVWTKQNAEELLKGTNYPVPIILWRLGKCKALQGSKTAKKFYDEAEKILLKNTENFTLFAQGLLVETDHFLTLSEDMNFNFLKKIKADVKNFFSLPLPISMRAAFKDFEKLDSAGDLQELLSTITKKIPVL